MQNKYDDPVFFEKYAGMFRSQKGLSGAGEWEALRAVLPPVKGKRVLDLGCGYGWHCAWARDQGADIVLGVDGSERMLDAAREKNSRDRVEYRRLNVEEAAFDPESFDLVLSSLVLHYIADIRAVYRQVYRWLSPGGHFVFTVEHPVFTAQGPQDWEYDKDGTIRHFPVDNYFYEGEREACFLGERVKKYHRTLATYLEGLLQAGFCIRHVAEPQPPESMLHIPGMMDEMRRPMMLIVCAEKEAAHEK